MIGSRESTDVGASAVATVTFAGFTLSFQVIRRVLVIEVYIAALALRSKLMFGSPPLVPTGYETYVAAAGLAACAGAAAAAAATAGTASASARPARTRRVGVRDTVLISAPRRGRIGAAVPEVFAVAASVP